MKHDLRHALEEDVRGEFHLPLLKLDGASPHEVYLGAAVADGALAVLVLHPAEGGKRELEVLRTLGAEHGIGITRCPRCATVAPGWPRLCAGCAHDPWRVAVAGWGGAGSLDPLREALDRQWPGTRLLGSIASAARGGAMYFVRGPRARMGLKRGPVVGAVIDRDRKGAPVVVPCWAMDEATLERFRAAAEAAVRPLRASPAVAGGDGASQPPKRTPAPAAGEAEKEQAVPLHRRREIRWAAAALLLLSSGALAFVPLIRGGGRQPIVPPPVDSIVSTVDTTRDSMIAAGLPAQPEAPDNETTRPKRPAPQPEPVVSPDTAVPAAPAPDPERDRQQVLALARGFAEAFGTQDIGRVRAAFAGISAEEERGWARWFENGHDLRVKFALDQGPVVAGDSATVGFTLGLRFARQRPCMVFDAKMARGGDGWILHRLHAGRPDAQACRSLHREWERETPAP